MKRILCLFIICIFMSSGASADRGTPQIVDESSVRSCTIRFAGDFVIHENVYQSALADGNGEEYDFSGMLDEVAPFLAAADFTVSNIDGVLGSETMLKKYGSYAGYPAFLTPTSLLDALKGCGVDMLSLANNHALDYWFDGLKSTVTTVEEAGFLHIGGFRTQEERDTPVVVDINGIKVGFFNYTDSLNMQDKQSRLDKDALKYGVCFTGYSADYETEVKRLRAAGAEVVVAYMHWGIEYRATPCLSQQNNAQALADAGVDVIIGGHPHHVQKMEWIGDTLCLYSLGNFLSDQRTPSRDCGIIFDFTLTEQDDGSIKVTDYSYTTTWVWRRTKENGGYQYKVLLSSEYLDSRPAGMSDTDYARMLESVDELNAIMAE